MSYFVNVCSTSFGRFGGAENETRVPDRVTRVCSLGYQREKDKLKPIFRNNVSCHDHSVTKNPAFRTVKFELRQTKSNGVSRSKNNSRGLRFFH
ncbi:hypothetical protein NPIL_362941 [Nephila pilipes]|uniref:Uncharacterized protein n=1 Tax=Nephila pilipes TaxID=299642 RepID=A0A8X6PY61_NEPPI|nr:hypothetical protein NPIL_362941 [Nephila pilipes]